MSIVPITSSGHFNTVLSTSTYVVVDFYADWCGPCKAIAPVFSHLATAESKPGRMTFVKVDVDSQQGVAKTYGVTAMPTFLILKNGKVTNTLRGADPAALRSAVLSASADAAKSTPKSSAAFTSKGHVLGADAGTSQRPRPAAARRPGQGITAMVDSTVRSLLRGGMMAGLVQFFGLYLTTLFSLDPHAAGEASMFNVRNRR